MGPSFSAVEGYFRVTCLEAFGGTQAGSGSLSSELARVRGPVATKASPPRRSRQQPDLTFRGRGSVHVTARPESRSRSFLVSPAATYPGWSGKYPMLLTLEKMEIVEAQGSD